MPSSISLSSDIVNVSTSSEGSVSIAEPDSSSNVQRTIAANGAFNAPWPPSKDTNEIIKGLLFDLGNGCSVPTPNPLILPDPTKFIALVDATDITCDFPTKLRTIESLKIPSAFLYTSDVNRPDASAKDSNLTLSLKAWYIDYESGLTLKDRLTGLNQSFTSTPPSSADTYSRRIQVSMNNNQSYVPGIWEFTLIIVVVLLAISFLTSVIMHCHLYRLQRRRAALNGGADAALENNRRRRRHVMEEEEIQQIPVKVYSRKLRQGTNDSDETLKMPDADIDEIISPKIVDDDVKKDENNTKTDTTLFLGIPDISTMRRSKSMDVSRSEFEATQISSLPRKSLDIPMHMRKNIKNEGACSLKEDMEIDEIKGTGAIPRKSISSIKSNSSTKSICPICLDDYVEGETLVRELPTCGHHFHVDCIDMWLSRRRANCPLCQRLVKEETEEEATDEAIVVVEGDDATQSNERMENQVVTELRFLPGEGPVMVMVDERNGVVREDGVSMPTTRTMEQVVQPASNANSSSLWRRMFHRRNPEPVQVV